MDDDTQSSICVPEEIVAAILVRLPITTVCRFMCVSNRWKSIVSNPNFGKHYKQQQQQRPNPSCLPALLYPLTDSTKVLFTPKDHGDPLSFNASCMSLSNDDETRHQLVTSSNGLLLSIALPSYVDQGFILHVSNPLTKQSVQLPKSTTLVDARQLVIGFATRRSALMTTYRVVLIQRTPYDCLENHAKTSVEVFSSDTGRWDVAWRVRFPVQVLDENAEPCVAYKGVLHWFSWQTNTVVTFDAYHSPYRLGCIELPQEIRSLSHQSLIYSCDEESLECCAIYLCKHDARLWVWKLVEGKWCLQGEFRVPEEFTSSLIANVIRKLVAPNPWERDIICVPYAIDNKVMFFDPMTRRLNFVKLLVDTSTAAGRTPRFSFNINSGKDPLIPITLCPWASPFYVQPTN